MTIPRNPVLPGFNPDPSVLLVDGVYYLATSSFEYLPGLPIYRSTDLVSWVQIGNVATRPEQLGVESVPSVGGAWAPTLRHRDGTFYLIVSVMFGSRSQNILFTATDPAGPWSDGLELPNVDGMDPDLAWGEDGTAYITFAQFGRGIWQLSVDLVTGRADGPMRPLWSGTGLLAPEGPHLYKRGEFWYLLIAEGGTERGHAVSIARGPSPTGPFTGHPHNPILSARSTNRPVQNLGHADLIEKPDGGTAMVLLGVRPVGFTHAFSPLGRETFLTDVDWIDGWPVPQPIELGESEAESFVADLTSPTLLDDPAWIAVRRLPSDVATVTTNGLSIACDGNGLSALQPAFVGIRQRHHTITVSAHLDVAAGVGGLSARYSELLWFAVEAQASAEGYRVTARASLSGLEQSWQGTLPAGPLELRIETRLPSVDPTALEIGGDRIRLLASGGGEDLCLAELDGRYWSFETSELFTGRVIGMHAQSGTVTFTGFSYAGR